MCFKHRKFFFPSGYDSITLFISVVAKREYISVNCFRLLLLKLERYVMGVRGVFHSHFIVCD